MNREKIDEEKLLDDVLGIADDFYDFLQRTAKLYGLKSLSLKGSRGNTFSEGIAAEIIAEDYGLDPADIVQLINDGALPNNSGIISEALKRR